MGYGAKDRLACLYSNRTTVPAAPLLVRVWLISHGPKLSTWHCAIWWLLHNSVGYFCIEWIRFSAHKLNRSFTANSYVQLRGDSLQPFMDFMYPNYEGILMDTPCHRNTLVQDWFEEYSRQFQ
ncbi:hypothetical protein TNCV_525701 [Trichonephila clavipes]|nr:hypothetical protein TNCV_525701 [Trichonephila clavipes]